MPPRRTDRAVSLPQPWGGLSPSPAGAPGQAVGVYARYQGILETSAPVQARIAAGGSTDFGEVHFVTQPRFETGDPRYAWLNAVVAVGEGRLLPSAVEYRVHRALPG